MENITLKVNKEDVKKTLRIMLSDSGIDSFAALGRELGYKETTFRSALNNNALRLKDFLEAAQITGYEVIVKKKE